MALHSWWHLPTIFGMHQGGSLKPAIAVAYSIADVLRLCLFCSVVTLVLWQLDLVAGLHKLMRSGASLSSHGFGNSAAWCVINITSMGHGSCNVRMTCKYA